MTGKEAIEKIQRYREYMCRQCLTPLMIGKCRDKCIAKALDMAIDSLVMADMREKKKTLNEIRAEYGLQPINKRGEQT